MVTRLLTFLWTFLKHFHKHFTRILTTGNSKKKKKPKLQEGMFLTLYLYKRTQALTIMFLGY